MRLIKRGVAAPSDGSGYSRGGRPDWLKKWIADQGVWCRLACGCAEDLNSQSLLIIGTFTSGEVYCERHDRFAAVKNKIRLDEALGYVAEKIPDEPLF